VVIDRNKGLDSLKSYFSSINNPFRQALDNSLSRLRPLRSPLSEPQLQEQAKDQEIAVLKAQIDQFQQDNQRCQKFLNSPLPAEWRFVLAHSLGIREGVLTLDKGAKDSVQVGDTVVSDQVLVGRVVESLPHNCRVELLNAGRYEVKAKTLSSQAEGVVQYDSHLNQLFLTQVLNEKELQSDEVVVTTGQDGLFPPNLVIGQVQEIQKVESEIYQKALLKPLVDPSTQTIFFIKTN
jgi:rod shape-determining protein MreC